MEAIHSSSISLKSTLSRPPVSAQPCRLAARKLVHISKPLPLGCRRGVLPRKVSLRVLAVGDDPARRPEPTTPEVTAPAPPPPFSRDLRFGDRGRDVKKLQTEILKIKGNGKFDAATHESLRAWQNKHDLPTTGVFGPLSREVAANLLAHGSARPQANQSKTGTTKSETKVAETKVEKSPVSEGTKIEVVSIPSPPVQPSAVGSYISIFVGAAVTLYAIVRFTGRGQLDIQSVATCSRSILLDVMAGFVYVFYALRKSMVQLFHRVTGTEPAVSYNPAPIGNFTGGATAPSASFILDQDSEQAAPKSNPTRPAEQKEYKFSPISMPDDDEAINSETGRQSKQWDYYLKAMERRKAEELAIMEQTGEDKGPEVWNKMKSWAGLGHNEEAVNEGDIGDDEGRKDMSGARQRMRADEVTRRSRLDELSAAYNDSRPEASLPIDIPNPVPAPTRPPVDPSTLAKQLKAVDQFYERHPTALSRKTLNPQNPRQITETNNVQEPTEEEPKQPRSYEQ
mmetsp:Transcript_21233/g.25551  ORF Transcript_21233/g.25551 Transcript_21233/m.25551 type:complete len:511 (+) Transcript_21233:210-1742(+)|eukprot:CAMPEP_0197856118 /NCGR_PEP_ID=MMETSP1438-20131217/27930_1 /TAXON_ID=1461541 /ORGANISM="Pterosperma sp., Strain CCMP1384" /LENGTH=510 /DNA_ID=CAMNT_0043471465 /DNA_START=138 /DNA_END=1670 /DNA_ORIENTATION=-